MLLFFSPADISKMGSLELRSIYNYSTFLLDRASGMLYLGARDAIIAVDTANLSKRKLVSSLFSCSECHSLTIMQKPTEKLCGLFIEETKVMPTSRLTYKKYTILAELFIYI